MLKIGQSAAKQKVLLKVQRPSERSRAKRLEVGDPERVKIWSELHRNMEVKMIGKIQKRVLENIELYNEFELIEYIRGKSAKVRLKCLECGHEFERYAHSFSSHPHMCPRCRPKGRSQRMSMEEAQKRTDTAWGKGAIELIEYNGNNSLAKWKCLECNHFFESVPSSVWRKRTSGCPICTSKYSIGVNCIRRFLEKHKLEYELEYRIQDCKNKLPLPFDFYIKSCNTLIEFHGEQHYRKASLYYSPQTQVNDAIKKDYCEQNQIPLIVIYDYQIDQIEEILSILTEEK